MPIKRPSTPLRCSLAIAFVTLILAGGALAQTEVVLHTFKGFSDGSDPFASLLADKSGNLYGTTSEGGSGRAPGNGTVFELTPPAASGGQWTGTILYRFGSLSATDGKGPAAPLIFDSAGNLYGSTNEGGTSNFGIVFQLSPPAAPGGAWTETVLYNFPSQDQGIANRTPLLLDSQGNLYGESSGFPDDNGGIFQLSPPATQGGSWTYSLLYTFPTNGLEGAYPQGGLIWDQNGNLYGVAAYAGTATCTIGGGGCGLVFELVKPATQGGAWTEDILHPFINGNGDGLNPNAVMFHNGSLYGTTSYGGDEFGDGTIFQLSPPATKGGAWTETVIFAFDHDNSYGSRPNWGVVFDKAGDLYTTLSIAGFNSGATQDAFELSPPATKGAAWTPAVVYNFTGGSDGGGLAISGLIFGKGNALYGTTMTGGASGHGVVFAIRP